MRKPIIDITTTATLRPELLRVTLESFCRNLFKDVADCRLIINVDPVGGNCTQFEVLEVARMFFRKVCYSIPKNAGFPEAFKWCWEQVEAPWVFNLEEDWELLHDVDLIKMITIMEETPHLCSLRLPASPAGNGSIKCWNLFFPWNGSFYECPIEKVMSVGFCGHPSLLRGEFVKRCAPHIDVRMNPEKQFHRGPRPIMTAVSEGRFGVHATAGDPPAIRDIGRKWMIQNGWMKEGNRAFFTQWKKVQ